ncbi:MAG: hypothetical protein JWN00_4963 [Actinomycetia bacterium]|nr:hypothetical protein [Actinomycetes bacterium]
MPSLPRQFRRTGQVALAIGSLLLLTGFGGLMAMGSGSPARVAPARTSARIAAQPERPVPEPAPIEARYVPPSIAPSPPATHRPVRPSAPQSSAPQPQPQPQPCPFHWPVFRDWCHRHGFQPPQ